MMKLALGLLGGVFVGTFFLEILRRKNPAVAQEIERRARRAVDAALH